LPFGYGNTTIIVRHWYFEVFLCKQSGKVTCWSTGGGFPAHTKQLVEYTMLSLKHTSKAMLLSPLKKSGKSWRIWCALVTLYLVTSPMPLAGLTVYLALTAERRPSKSRCTVVYASVYNADVCLW